jgi:perosamine synthetase
MNIGIIFITNKTLKKVSKMGDLSWRFDEREYIYIKEVLDSGFASSTSGNMNTRLEEAFAKRFNSNFAITFNSGTTTLHAALEAFGVGFGDEVITTPLTVISCMNAILYCGAIPVFADIDPDTFLIDPVSIEKNITPKTKAIMPVHLYGQVCDMTAIMSIAKKHNLFVLEDCAQCYLGEHRGKIGGTFGHVGSWSFENSKHLTTGDGGIVTCYDEDIADNIRKLNCQGFRNATAKSGKIRVSRDVFQNPSFKRHDRFGFMYRLPEVAAAMGLAQLEKIDWFVGLRQQMAKMYTDVIKETSCNWLIPQNVPLGDVNSYYTYAMRFQNKDVSWEEFRIEYIANGGDGIYAAWTLCYLEDSVNDIQARLAKMGLNERFNTALGQCSVAEKVQSQLMQLTTNQKDEQEMKTQAEALRKTITFFQ